MTQEQCFSLSLTDAEREEIVDSIRNRQLPDDVLTALEEYKLGAGGRDQFLWKWTQSVFPHVQFSSVDTRSDEVVATKTIVTMLVALYDDLLEKHGDAATFDQASLLPFHDNVRGRNTPDIDQEYLDSIEKVWTRIDSRIRTAPRHDEFRDLFEYDLRQILDAIEYSALLNETPQMANMTELRIHESSNMSMFVYADIDLMYSTGFDTSELGSLRDAVWHGQQMARIGNWLSTWERELREDDYSSAVVVRALEENTVLPESLRLAGETHENDSLPDLTERIRESGNEQFLLDLWKEERTQLRGLADGIDSVDIEQYVSGLETLLNFHLASRGLK